MLKLPFSLALCCATCLAIPALAAEVDPNAPRLDRPAIDEDVIIDVAPVLPMDPTDVSTSTEDEEATGLEGPVGNPVIVDTGSSDDSDSAIDSGNTGIDLGVIIAPENSQCMTTDCESLGYSKGSVIGCTSYINCPFDTSYKACVVYKDCTFDTSSVGIKVRKVIADELAVAELKLCDSANLKTDLGADSLDLVELRMALETEFDRDISDADANNMITVKDIINFFSNDEYTLSVCPANATCEGKYKITGCKDGYTLSMKESTGEITCTARSICPAGYELGTIYGTVTQKCYKTVCGKLGLTTGVAQYATFSNGYKVAISCSSGYTASTDSNGCISCQVTLSSNICPSGCSTGMIYKLGSLTLCCGSSGIAPNGTKCLKCTSKLTSGNVF